MKKTFNFNFKETLGRAGLVWSKYYKLIFVIFFLGISLWGGYLWYHYLYQFKWGSEQINQYVSSHAREVRFKEEDFKNVVNEVERRRNAYNESAKLVKDVMGPLGEKK